MGVHASMSMRIANLMRHLSIGLLVVGLLALIGLQACDSRCQNCKNNPYQPPPEAALGAPRGQIETYIQIVHRTYRDAWQSAVKMQTAIEAFLKAPSEASQNDARAAWIEARRYYSFSEAFRFYEGPIDFENKLTKQQGPESRLNGWPLNEAFIDYVKTDAASGLINNPAQPLHEQALIAKNATTDEKNITTGWHAIEFLLWGQDLSNDGPGARPWSDYTPTDEARGRRREYLRIVTALVVKDLKSLVAEWEPAGAENYAAQFRKMEPKIALGKILSGLASLSGFELAAERIGTPLDTREQEDEQSCFSDNTHNDLINNIEGIINVLNGKYGDYRGMSMTELVAETDQALFRRFHEQMAATIHAADKMPQPFDQTLRSAPGSPQRKQAEELVKELIVLTKMLKELGAKLGVEVVVAGG